MERNAFRQAIESFDIEAVKLTLAPDVTFYSPVMVRPYQGREVVGKFLGVLSEVFEGLHYTNELAGKHGEVDPNGAEGTQALIFKARAGGKDVQGLDLLTFDEGGLVSDLTVMVRPLPAAMTVARLVGARMEELTIQAEEPSSGATND